MYETRYASTRPAGKAASPMSRREQKMLLRLLAAAAVLLLAVGVKLTAPRTLLRWQERFAQAVNAEMDVQEVFSAVGEAVSGEGEDGWQEVYKAVFFPSEATAESTSVSGVEELPETSPATEETAETAETETTPQTVCMTQQVLGFDFVSPLDAVTTSGFGLRESPVSGDEEFHYGLDLAAEEGTEIRCFADGRVKAVGDSSSLGNYLIVDHTDGYSTLYAHCSRVIASAGKAVAMGETIAEVGQSGNATGPHLHFVLYRGSTYLNPIYYL